MKKSKTTTEFIEDAKKVHGDLYDYSKVKYINNSSKIKIICKIHGVFEQVPISHLNRKGCFECGKAKRTGYRRTTKEFILDSQDISEIENDMEEIIVDDFDGDDAVKYISIVKVR